MTIAVSLEPKNLGTDLELCCLCNRPTPYWSVLKDVPVCLSCSTEHEQEDVPKKEEWIDG